ncbi:MAG TPA: sulfotransferase domain-containing protein [Sphingomonadaceae bacterium]|nr:sulfotransferase domain-containing protein [Sphingomonadaceae bacterium]
MDSTIWDRFQYRDGDVVIGAWAKSGSTWVQQIVGQLILGPDPDFCLSDNSTWLELRAAPPEDTVLKVAKQTHRRFVKTHLPFDALPYSPKAKYIYLVRDGRDVVWSLFHHHHNVSDHAYELLNDSPGLVGPPLERPTNDIRRYWKDWMEKDGYPFWPYWAHIESWWKERDRPNIMFLHFNDLKSAMVGKMREIAEFIGVDVRPGDWPELIEYCTFAWMREHAETVHPEIGTVFKGGSKAFFNRGCNGAWQNLLTPEEVAEYEARAVIELGSQCAHWVINGGPIAGQGRAPVRLQKAS